MNRNPIIAVVDDDESVRESVQSLLRSLGYRTAAFTSAEEFLKANHPHDVDCLIVDVRMPGMSGLELQRRLAVSGSSIPIIFITAHAADTAAREQALTAGAVAFLSKPFNEEVLLSAVESALHS